MKTYQDRYRAANGFLRENAKVMTHREILSFLYLWYRYEAALRKSSKHARRRITLGKQLDQTQDIMTYRKELNPL